MDKATDKLPVVMMKLEDIIPYEKNVKIHNDAQIEKLASNIKRFGFDQPIVVDKDNVIIKGHGRRLACIKLGMTYVPVLKRTDLTKEEADAARLSDNRVTSTEYDIEGLQAEIERLSADFNFENLGFDQRELNFSIDNINIDVQDAFVDDLEAAMTQYEESGTSLAEEAKSVPLHKILGFKEVDSDKTYALNKFLENAIIKYNLPPKDSFCQAISDIVEKDNG